MKKLILLALLFNFIFPYNININTNLQDSKLIDKDKWEFSSLLIYQDVFGRKEKFLFGSPNIQIIKGLNEKYNLRFGFEQRKVYSLINYNIGLKYKLRHLVDAYRAFYLPITLTQHHRKKSYLKSDNLIQIEPTYLISYDYYDYSIDTSVKAFIPINSSDVDIQLGGSLGFTMSINSSKWIIRSEISFDNISGIFTDPDVGLWTSSKFNIGLSIIN